MVKPATVNRIKELSREGKSSNEIVRTLRREHRGIRRTTALTYVREFKGRAPKKEPYKHIPKKYLTTERRIHIEHDVKQKHVAIYGRVKGKSRRIEVSGTGHQLYSFVEDAIEHPPKERFAKGYIGTVHDRSKIKLSKREEWDAKPKISS